MQSISDTNDTGDLTQPKPTTAGTVRERSLHGTWGVLGSRNGGETLEDNVF